MSDLEMLLLMGRERCFPTDSMHHCSGEHMFPVEVNVV